MTMKLIGPQELAEILDISTSWVYVRTREKGPGSIPHLKVGKYVKFELENGTPKKVMDWIRAQNDAE